MKPLVAMSVTSMALNCVSIFLRSFPTPLCPLTWQFALGNRIGIYKDRIAPTSPFKDQNSASNKCPRYCLLSVSGFLMKSSSAHRGFHKSIVILYCVPWYKPVHTSLAKTTPSPWAAISFDSKLCLPGRTSTQHLELSYLVGCVYFKEQLLFQDPAPSQTSD